MTLNFKNKNIYNCRNRVNHNGSLSIAKKLILAGKKHEQMLLNFKISLAEKLVTINAKKSSYQIKNTKNDNLQFKMLKR